MLGKMEDEKGMIEDEMVGWHHQLSGLEIVKTGKLLYYHPHSHKASDMTERLDNNNIKCIKNSCNLSATMAKLLNKCA